MVLTHLYCLYRSWRSSCIADEFLGYSAVYAIAMRVVHMLAANFGKLDGNLADFDDLTLMNVESKDILSYY